MDCYYFIYPFMTAYDLFIFYLFFRYLIWTTFGMNCNTLSLSWIDMNCQVSIFLSHDLIWIAICFYLLPWLDMDCYYLYILSMTWYGLLLLHLFLHDLIWVAIVYILIVLSWYDTNCYYFFFLFRKNIPFWLEQQEWVL